MPAAVSRPSSRRWPPSCAPRTVNTRESEGTVPVNLTLGHVSNDFLIAALLIYSLAVVAFAGDFAFGRPRRAGAAAQVQDRERALAAVGATTTASAGDGQPPATAPDSMPELQVPALRAIGRAGPWVRAGMALSV